MRPGDREAESKGHRKGCGVARQGHVHGAGRALGSRASLAPNSTSARLAAAHDGSDADRQRATKHAAPRQVLPALRKSKSIKTLEAPACRPRPLRPARPRSRHQGAGAGAALGRGSHRIASDGRIVRGGAGRPCTTPTRPTTTLTAATRGFGQDILLPTGAAEKAAQRVVGPHSSDKLAWDLRGEATTTSDNVDECFGTRYSGS